MKNNNSNKTWNFNFFNGAIHFEFSESIDIREAFEAMKAKADEESWLDELNGIDTATDTFEMDCMMYGSGYSEALTSIIKAVAETFPAISFNGSAWYSEFKCYADIEMTFSFVGKILYVTESFADEGNGYFCPECGCWIARADAEYDEDAEFGCGDCEEVFKFSDLRFVPPAVTESEYIIG